jgi:hypothetical protein
MKNHKKSLKAKSSIKKTRKTLAKMAFLPAYDLGEPGRPGGHSIEIKSDDIIYSTYTGEQVAVGPVKKGMKCDAPKGHKNYKKKFHVIERDAKGNLMMHRLKCEY